MNRLTSGWQESFHFRGPLGIAERIGPFVIDIQGFTKKTELVNELNVLATLQISNCRTWQEIDTLNDVLQKYVGNEKVRIRVSADYQKNEEVSYLYRKIFVNVVNKKIYEIGCMSHEPCDLHKMDLLISHIGKFKKTNIAKEIAVSAENWGIKMRVSLRPFSVKSLLRRRIELEKAMALERIIISPSAPHSSTSKQDKINSDLLSVEWKSKDQVESLEQSLSE